ncbi:LysE family transporter [Sporomusa sp. KB1]|jgi:threonine/homoserine/homoserine lactone efflux protein|uniref:LysE family transporter n=1 Tax=Sporomusa sp. KB1 TaxID=943346 RepID=UPI0011A4909E|nr:LysE family transporter [Sporomusa sp. KB1]TWH44936.1 threonine/homoserine/homoserine lactone efflux protein [Sporomusa sp. KB1]
MDYITLFTTAFLVGLSGAMMPGPMLTVTISETPRRGFWVGPQIVLGHTIVELLLVVCLAGGLTYYIQQSIVTGGIGLIGGLVLLWFGWGIYISAKNREVSLGFSELGNSSERTMERQSMRPWISGIILSLTNPYWSLWWATVGVSYVVVAMSLGTIGLITFFAGHILSDLAWFSLVSFIIHTGRSFISDRLYQGVLMICAAFLILLGCWFSYDGFQKLALL